MAVQFKDSTGVDTKIDGKMVWTILHKREDIKIPGDTGLQGE